MSKFLPFLGAALMLATTNIVRAEAFTYLEDFDNPENFTSDAQFQQPQGWLSEGEPWYAFYRDQALNFGVWGGHSGDYVYGTGGSPTSPRNERFYTQGFNLKGGKECTVSFFLMAPGGTPPSVRNNSIAVTAGTAQTADSQTIEVGKTGFGAWAEWTQFTYTFTPDTDGTYYISFYFEDPQNTVGQRGMVLIDDVEISGETADEVGGGTGTETVEEPFSYFEDFDNPEDFTSDAQFQQPQGWLSEGEPWYAFYRDQALNFGVWGGHSGDYVYGTGGSPTSPRTERFYTQGFNLKGGKECTVSFFLMAPGGTPPSVRNNSIAVTAGTAQTADSQTIEVGKTGFGAWAEWTQFTYTFTPDTDGTYYISFYFEDPQNTVGQRGMVLIDDVEISGTSVKEGGEPETPASEVATLADFATKDPTAGEKYIFKGEATVSFVDFINKKVYVQDAANGMIIDAADLVADVTVNIGDNITDFACTVAEQNAQLVLVPAEGTFGIIASSGNTVAAVSATLTEVAAAPATYLNRVVKLATVELQGVEMGDVFTEDGLTMTDGTTTGTLAVLEASEIADNAVPALKVDVTGLSLSTDGAVIAPRSIDDIQAYQEPIVHETQPLPYLQSFDNAEDYDGESYLPKGWKATGSVPAVTASMKDLKAVTGTYYMVLDQNDNPRDERVYSPFFNMTAGTEYTVSYYIYMPGYVAVEDLRTNNFSFTVGTDQEVTAQTTTLKSEENAAYGEWTKHEVKFTPATDGQYCFSFNFESPLNYTGYVAVDDFFVTAQGMILKPTAAMAVKGWYDIMDGNMVVFEGEAIQMVNLSQNATDFEWVVTGAVPETSVEENPSFQFPNEGKYTVKLTASNSTGSRTTYKELNVTKLASEKVENAGIMNFSQTDKVHFQPLDAPKYSTDEMYDFVCGVNHYYRKFAQRYEIPGDREMTLKSITIGLSAYSRKMEYTAEQRNYPFTIAVYGETDGRIDENKLFGKKESTVVDELGQVGIGIEHPTMWGFNLEENPIKVKGTFYIAYEFGESMSIDTEDPNIVRSYVGFSSIEHSTKETTLYAKPTAGPEGFTPDGGWYRVDQIDRHQAGLGMYSVLWGDLEDKNGSVAINSEGKIAYALRNVDNTLTVSGTVKNDTLRIFNTSGMMVASAACNDNSTEVSVDNLPAGIYIVSTSKGSLKFIK